MASYVRSVKFVKFVKARRKRLLVDRPPVYDAATAILILILFKPHLRSSFRMLCSHSRPWPVDCTHATVAFTTGGHPRVVQTTAQRGEAMRRSDKDPTARE